MNSGSERELDPTNDPLGLSRGHHPRDDEHAPPHRCQLRQSLAVLAERNTTAVVRPTIALQRQLQVGPCEVEAVATSGRRYPHLPRRRRNRRTAEQEPDLRLEAGF